MHKRAFQGLKRTFMHVSGLLDHILLKKPNTLKIGFFKSKYGGGRPETSMHKRAFQALKRTLMKVSDLPPSYFDFKKLIIYKLVFLSKYGWGRPDTCMRFRPRNARLCMSQVFAHLIVIKKNRMFYKKFF